MLVVVFFQARSTLFANLYTVKLYYNIIIPYYYSYKSVPNPTPGMPLNNGGVVVVALPEAVDDGALEETLVTNDI